MKDTKHIWFWVGVVIVILLAVVISYTYLDRLSFQGGATQSVQETTKAIIQSGDAAKCASVNDVANGVNYETVCENDIAWNNAQANLDVNACNGLDNKLMSIAACQAMVITAIVNNATSTGVCDQFTGSLHDSCVGDYWFTAAAAKEDPRLCSNLASSTVSACQENVLASVVSGTSTLTCSLFTATSTQADCQNYTKLDCKAITAPSIAQECYTKEAKKS